LEVIGRLGLLEPETTVNRPRLAGISRPWSDARRCHEETDDIKFPEYLYQRCIADDEAAPAQQQRRMGLISRLFRWMAQPI